MHISMLHAPKLFERRAAPPLQVEQPVAEPRHLRQQVQVAVEERVEHGQPQNGAGEGEACDGVDEVHVECDAEWGRGLEGGQD
eukprot:56613-Eustigmatos_ZCMA.PRE.1